MLSGPGALLGWKASNVLLISFIIGKHCSHTLMSLLNFFPKLIFRFGIGGSLSWQSNKFVKWEIALSFISCKFVAGLPLGLGYASSSFCLLELYRPPKECSAFIHLGERANVHTLSDIQQFLVL